MDNRVAIIIPFFGNLNCKGYFQKFLDSCKENSKITWLIFTDDRTQYDYPENVKITYMSFETLKALVQNKFDFPIALPTSYKLCDFKPAYGEIFEEYITDYDWWGFSDTDLIWGRMNHFITDDLLNNYEQLYSRGHLTLSLNNSKMRTLYRDFSGFEVYKKIFADEKHHAFDELHTPGGFREIIKRREIALYDELDFADIAKLNRFGFFSFELAQVQLKQNEKLIGTSVFMWNAGDLVRIYYQAGELKRKEYLYVHFQRRVLHDKSSNRKSYCIVPNMIVDTPAFFTAFRIRVMHCNGSNLINGSCMINVRIRSFLIRIINKTRR